MMAIAGKLAKRNNMPPTNNDRKHNKRELERAVGSLTWSIQHIQTVYDAFYNTAYDLSTKGEDVPDSYISTIEALTECITALLSIADIVNKINEGI